MRHRSWIRVPQILTGPFSPQFFSLFPEIRRPQRSVLNVPFRQIGRLTRPISKKNRKRGFGTHNHSNCGPILKWERGTLVQPWNHVFSIRIFAKNVFQVSSSSFPVFCDCRKTQRGPVPPSTKNPKKNRGRDTVERKKDSERSGPERPSMANHVLDLIFKPLDP